MMVVEEAVPQITPVACFSDWCGEPFAGVVLFAAFWAVLIAGAPVQGRRPALLQTSLPDPAHLRSRLP